MKITSRCLLAIAFAIGFGVTGWSQEVTPAEPAYQKAYLEQKAIDKLFDEALASSNFDDYIDLLNRHPSHRRKEIEKIGSLQPKNQAQLLIKLLSHGPIQYDDQMVVGNAESLGIQYDMQDTIIVLAYHLLKQTPPPLPSSIDHLLTRSQALTLVEKLQKMN